MLQVYGSQVGCFGLGALQRCKLGMLTRVEDCHLIHINEMASEKNRDFCPYP